MILGRDGGSSDGTVATVVHPDSSTGIISPAAAPILEQPAALASSLSITDTPIKRERDARLYVGPMLVKDFIDKFLPNPGDNDISDFTSRFASASESDVFNLRSIQREQDVYQPFYRLTGMQDFAPQLSFVNTSKNADTKNCSSFTFNVMPDVCVYADGTSDGCDITKAEVHIEFKWNDALDAFKQKSWSR
ncbi:hypothetical protein DFJ58DRAFT_721484 [Suillus subalutaceus]|uniref:uncharacterized protein n=1 Tax=Suillus subalutaceus TaxID=48586 RepID=UPI001B85BDD8|nr:uncharacterized protein DFJ58DRAFT_721484 [Suillus subalutaceus]KAG1875660.1 hypothetical protein DFJ58DRAFT_721484 [Suillus subalutaceus]